MTFNFAPSATFAPLACPRCAGEMVQEPRSGILVDRCGGCRGVFLDRGELERLIDAVLSTGPSMPAADPRTATRRPPERDDREREVRWEAEDDDDRGWGGQSRSGAAPKRRGGLFRDLFEGFGD